MVLFGNDGGTWKVYFFDSGFNLLDTVPVGDIPFWNGIEANGWGQGLVIPPNDVSGWTMTVWYYVQGEPYNPYLEIGTPDDSYEWDYSGWFNSTDYVYNFSSAINDALNHGMCDCQGCILEDDNCSVPFTFHSDGIGVLEYSGLLVEYKDNSQSVILNLGPTNTSFYINLTVQYLGQGWVNEEEQYSSLMRIVPDEEILLSDFWDGWNTSTTNHGAGDYRVKVELVDELYNVLANKDGRYNNDSYSFILEVGPKIFSYNSTTLQGYGEPVYIWVNVSNEDMVWLGLTAPYENETIH
jgi:hypothetical protein